MSIRLGIGVGCRRACSAEAIEQVVRQALERAPWCDHCTLFTIHTKQDEPGLITAAERLELRVIGLTNQALLAQSAAIQTHSARVTQRFGVGSVAEAAALAGLGPNARLIVPRVANGWATCAVAARPA